MSTNFHSSLLQFMLCLGLYLLFSWSYCTQYDRLGLFETQALNLLKR